MSQQQLVCDWCGQKFWPKQSWMHNKCRKEHETRDLPEPEEPLPKISAKVISSSIRKRGRPKTQTEEQRKDKWRIYMRSYMADRRAKIKLSESE